MFSVLDPEVVSQHPVTLDERFTLPGNIQAELFAVPGKVPLYLEQAGPQGVVENEVNVGIEVAVGTARLTFVPGAAAVTPSLGKRLAEADVVLFDGTVFTDDEMIASGTGTKTGRRMGHMPIDGADGSLARLAGLSRRRIYVHINNTNPILIDGSPERKRVEAAGWEVATDGLEIVL
jgi:pyrroloquinoline quinone biosynthesis protein B